MPTMIQLRHVPDDLHRKLKARAAMEGLSLSDYLIREVRQIAEKPTMSEMMERLARLTPVHLKEICRYSFVARRSGIRRRMPSPATKRRKDRNEASARNSQTPAGVGGTDGAPWRRAAFHSAGRCQLFQDA